MKDHLTDAVMATPPTAVVGLTVYGIGLADWVYILSAVYTIFLIIDKAPVVFGHFRRLLSKKDNDVQGK